MKTRHGDLIQLAKQGRFDVIIHGCNCFCTMGAGIAHLIQKHFPKAYQADVDTIAGDKAKLGTFSCAQIEHNGNIFTIVNGYTQYEYSGPGPLVDYEALAQLFSKIKKEYSGLKIAYPKIGAGLARGNWKKIAAIIDLALKGEDHTLVIFRP